MLDVVFLSYGYNITGSTYAPKFTPFLVQYTFVQINFPALYPQRKTKGAGIASPF
jgi:hypothetical protein